MTELSNAAPTDEARVVSLVRPRRDTFRDSCDGRMTPCLLVLRSNESEFFVADAHRCGQRARRSAGAHPFSRISQHWTNLAASPDELRDERRFEHATEVVMVVGAGWKVRDLMSVRLLLLSCSKDCGAGLAEACQDSM